MSNQTKNVKPPVSFPAWKFKAVVYRAKLSKRSRVIALTIAGSFPSPEFYSVLVAKNGNILYASETKKSRTGLIRTIKNNFPGIEIVDLSNKK
jgi:uncharacterized protein YegP (UPF0339 family)